MSDRIKVSTIELQFKSLSYSDGGRPPVAAQSQLHPPGCTLFVHFCGPNIGTHFKILIIVFAFLFILTGCYESHLAIPVTPPPSACAVFAEARWQEFGFGVDSPEDVATTVASLWGIDKEEVLIDKLSNSGRQVRWWDDNNRLGYVAQFGAERQLTFVRGSWSIPEPTSFFIIDCLGPPDYYEYNPWIAPEGEGVNVGFWYLEKGFVVESWVTLWFSQPPEAITPGFRMKMFRVVEPGTPGDKVPNKDLIGEDPDERARVLCRLRPWPGSLESTELEVRGATCHWEFDKEGEPGGEG